MQLYINLDKRVGAPAPPPNGEGKWRGEGGGERGGWRENRMDYATKIGMFSNRVHATFLFSGNDSTITTTAVPHDPFTCTANNIPEYIPLANTYPDNCRGYRWCYGTAGGSVQQCGDGLAFSEVNPPCDFNSSSTTYCSLLRVTQTTMSAQGTAPPAQSSQAMSPSPTPSTQLTQSVQFTPSTPTQPSLSASVQSSQNTQSLSQQSTQTPHMQFTQSTSTLSSSAESTP